jgi:hypothetical protein
LVEHVRLRARFGTPLVYDELRELAAQRFTQVKPGQTLQATALVHEAYLRLVDVEKAQLWKIRSHFFAASRRSRPSFGKTHTFKVDRFLGSKKTCERSGRVSTRVWQSSSGNALQRSHDHGRKMAWPAK